MTTLHHGTNSVETSFTAIQHDCAIVDNGYIEIIQILDLPENKKPFVVNHYDSTYRYYTFCEVATLSVARDALQIATSDTQNVIKNWKKSGIEKVFETGHPSTALSFTPTTSLPSVLPWFYSKSKELFGRHGEFTTLQRLVKSSNGIQAGHTYVVFTPTQSIRIDQVAGICEADRMIYWKSGEIQLLESSERIPFPDEGWNTAGAIQNWAKSLAEKANNVVGITLRFPKINRVLVLLISYARQRIYASIDVWEEELDIRLTYTYSKKVSDIPESLYSLDGSCGASIAEVVKFFVHE